MSTVSKLVRSARAFSRELAKARGGEQQQLSLTEPRRLRLGIALGGGFARGLVHIGVLKALEEAQITVDFVAGTSVGAIIGACYCAGVTAEELKEIARATRFKDFARWTLSRYGFCSNDRMQQFCAHSEGDHLRRPENSSRHRGHRFPYGRAGGVQQGSAGRANPRQLRLSRHVSSG